MIQRVLLIEDDTRLAEMVSEYLGEAGFRVSVAAQGRAGLEWLAREPFDAFRKHEGNRYQMGEALICLFEESTTYANAKELIGHLEDLQHWEPSYAKRIRAAAKTNSQIYDSWGASRVSSLANRWESED